MNMTAPQAVILIRKNLSIRYRITNSLRVASHGDPKVPPDNTNYYCNCSLSSIRAVEYNLIA